MCISQNNRTNNPQMNLGFRRIELVTAVILVVAIILLGLQYSSAADSSGRLGFTAPGSPIVMPSDSPPTEKDCQFALFAREALLKDETLAPFNVGVTVRSGKATLWGTVPSPTLAHRAEERIRLVPGLAQVKNDLRIYATDDDLAEFLKGPPSQSNPPIQESKRWDHSTPLVSRPEESRLTLSQRPPPLLMPPIQIPARPAKTVSTIEEVQAMKATPPPSLPEALHRFQMNNETFRRIRFDVQDGVVHLWSNSAGCGDVFRMAQEVAHVPGVKRVVVEQSR